MSDKRHVLRFTIYALLLVALLVLAVPAAAQEPVSDDEVNEVAKGVYCPVCENTPLDVCATKACADWRELIRTKLGEGQSQEEIEAYFARQYGDGVLAEPPRRGLHLLLWIFPVAALLAGGFFFARYLGTLRGRTTAEPVPYQEASRDNGAPETTAVSPTKSSREQYIEQIEKELRKR